jgi:hypothetical protein
MDNQHNQHTSLCCASLRTLDKPPTHIGAMHCQHRECDALVLGPQPCHLTRQQNRKQNGMTTAQLSCSSDIMKITGGDKAGVNCSDILTAFSRTAPVRAATGPTVFRGSLTYSETTCQGQSDMVCKQG